MEAQVNYLDNPVAWFVLLEQARSRNDFTRAAKAKEELKRLGISVSYSKVRKNKNVQKKNKN